MKSRSSTALACACLTTLAVTLSGCAASAARVTIPDSLKAPCVTTVDVSGAQTVGDLGSAIIQSDADLRVCSARKDAVVAIAESQNRRWWQLW
jgi:hypothetical protein